MAETNHKPEKSNAVKETYTWQNPQSQTVLIKSDKTRLAVMIGGGIVLFFLLAFIIAII